jgi:poly-gamma-glutamate synthesis protein (capsule biosynthesis protein)
VKAVKGAGADVVVVNFHWGEELAPEPTERDRALAYLAVESGADIVVGHHPHVLQPVEIHKGSVIAYSLGNLVFGGNSKRPRDSMLLEVTVAADGNITHREVLIRIQPEETLYQPYVLVNSPRPREEPRAEIQAQPPALLQSPARP